MVFYAVSMWEEVGKVADTASVKAHQTFPRLVELLYHTTSEIFVIANVWTQNLTFIMLWLPAF
jgi:hypothetical protein